MEQKRAIKYTLVSALLAIGALSFLKTSLDIARAGPPAAGMEGHPISALDQPTLYTRTLDAIADTTVLQGHPLIPFGNSLEMRAGYDDVIGGQIARSLVQFDIASLPCNSSIITATLRVYLFDSQPSPDVTRTITAYRSTANWSESSTYWNNMPGYASTDSADTIVHSAWGWYEFDVTDMVSAWSDGTHANYGIMLRGPEVSGPNSSWRSFSTREDPGRPPKLVVVYEDVQEYDVYLPVVIRNADLPSTPVGTH